MSAGYRRHSNGGWYRPGDDCALNWAELWTFVLAWANDTRFQLARKIDPDWEFKTIGNFFSSHILLAVQGANWQRSRGKAKDRPKLITPQMLRGEVDDSEETRNGVKSGSRKGRGIQVSSAGDFDSVKDRMRKRREQSREVGDGDAGDE